MIMEIPSSLAFSYLLLGTAIGLVTWFAVARMADRNNFGVSAQKVILAAVILSFLGILLATAHLGRMDRFMNLISNSKSWLSREGLLVGVFTACALSYLFLLKKRTQENINKIDPLLYGAVFAGLCTLVCMGMIYVTATAVPVWHTTFIVLIDILSSLLLGGVLFLVLVQKSLSPAFLRRLVLAVLCTSIVSIVVNLAYEVQVGMILSDLSAQGAAVPPVWLGTSVRAIIGLIIPAFLIAKSIHAKENRLTMNLNIALACIVIGEIAAKIMHFVVAIKTPFI